MWGYFVGGFYATPSLSDRNGCWHFFLGGPEHPNTGFIPRHRRSQCGRVSSRGEEPSRGEVKPRTREGFRICSSCNKSLKIANLKARREPNYPAPKKKPPAPAPKQEKKPIPSRWDLLAEEDGVGRGKKVK